MANNDRVAVVGVGYSTIGRRTGLTSRELTGQCAKAAMTDAGMTPADIDGVCMHGHVAGAWGRAAQSGGYLAEGMDAGFMLGMSPLNYYNTMPEVSPAFVGVAIHAIAAIKAGLCHTCIAFRIIPQRENIAASRATQSQGRSPRGGRCAVHAPLWRQRACREHCGAAGAAAHVAVRHDGGAVRGAWWWRSAITRR